MEKFLLQKLIITDMKNLYLNKKTVEKGSRGNSCFNF